MANDVFGGEGVTVGLVAGLPVEELARRLAVALRAGEACQRALAFYLHDMEARRLAQALGFPSTVHFAGNRLGLSKGTTRDLLRAGRRLEELGELDAAFARGELCWSKVRCIARVASPDNQAQWIERCRDLTAAQVEGITRCASEGDDPPSLQRGLPHARFVLRFDVGALEHEMFEQARAKLSAELGRVVTDNELLSELVRMLLSSDADGTVPGRKAVDGSLFRVVVQASEDAAAENARAFAAPADAPALAQPADAPTQSARAPSGAARPETEAVPVTRQHAKALDLDATLPPRVRKRVLQRDGHRCRHCGSPRGPMIHHIRFRSWGGGDDEQNLLTLCARCHGLRAPLVAREVVIGRSAPAAAASARASTATVPQYLEPHEVPAVVDG
ncbi:MAG TPA: HNH endonuclease, partial [Polyangiales bacterium]